MDMVNQTIDNKRIAKNTIFLYLRMLVVMCIGLYTVRAILDLLGVVDYGIYNVVGGVVAMFSFINGTLATSSQRYFSIELAKGDLKRLNQWFCLNISTFLLFILFFVIIAETIGLWFVNTQMTIPQERIRAANVVYQLSIASFCINFLSIPYNALIIARERMSVFAYIGIVEALLKLLIVFLLSVISWDKLIVYGLLMFVTSCGITLLYISYNRFYFSESKFRFYWNKQEVKELLSFSGWHFFGTFSVVVRSHGINILLNIFFNPAINAARAVAYQIYSAVTQLSDNFFTAVKPQIYKSYAARDYDSLYGLIMRSTVICAFLVSVLIFPIIINTQYILGLWLKEIPEYTVIFTQLILINGLIDSTNGPTIAPALATGKIRKYEVIVAFLTFVNLPISYVALSLGASPSSTIIISIAMSYISAIVRAYLLRKMIKLPFKQYLVLFIKLTVSSILIWIIAYYTIYNNAKSFVSLCLNTIEIEFLIITIYLALVIKKQDIKSVYNIIRR